MMLHLVAAGEESSSWRHLMELDGKVMERIDAWLEESRREETPEARRITLAARIRGAVAPLEQAYLDFMAGHPEHVPVRLGYASLLSDLDRDAEALPHLEKAVVLDPAHPAAWNNLANHHGYAGRAEEALECYDKAMDLAPDEAIYPRNLASIIRLYPKVAARHYAVGSGEVTEMARSLYRKALKLDPTNFDLAEDLAQSYYTPTGIDQPTEALSAWKRAAVLTPSSFEREGVALHLARVHLALDQPEQARGELDLVTLPLYRKLRKEIEEQLDEEP